MASTFTQLPAEILESIFLNLDPQSLLSVAQTCRRVQKLTADAPLIWRHFCKTHFTSWDPKHDIAAKFAGPLSNVNWRALFIRRVRVERETLRLLDRVLETQHKRTQHIDAIVEFGYDVKEVLLKECACDHRRDDVLARKYYSNAILERVQREMALEVWADLDRGDDVPIEKALAAYDIFTRTGEFVDFGTVAHHLDDLAKGLVQQYPDLDTMSARAKASTLASFLREQGFQGVADSSYSSLRNSFIALVLSSEEHESLPLISVAIYCAVARHVGLDARPCGFLYHMYCLVYAPKDYTLDGVYKPTSSSDLEHMYLDPFRSSDEVLADDLQRSLREMGVPTSQHAGYMSDCNTRDMVVRTARNIMNSVQTIRQTEAGAYGVHPAWLNAYPDMDNAFYATIWVMLILSPQDDITIRRRQYLPYLLEHFQTHYPWDVSLLQRYVIPMFDSLYEGQRLTSFVERMRSADRLGKEARPRDSIADRVTFRVGQLFRHKRYHYEGVIIGWDPICSAGEDWINNMDIDRLPGGRHQAFYHVM